jgi:type II secretion system protein G
MMSMRQAATKPLWSLLLAGCLLSACGGEGENTSTVSPGPEPTADEELTVFMASDPSEYLDEVRQDMNHIVIPLFFYASHTGTWPTTEEGLRALIERPQNPAVAAKWLGEYIPTDIPDADQLFIDPWGKAYVYRQTPDGEKPFELKSLGPDGVESEDDISYTAFDVSELIR